MRENPFEVEEKMAVVPSQNTKKQDFKLKRMKRANVGKQEEEKKDDGGKKQALCELLAQNLLADKPWNAVLQNKNSYLHEIINNVTAELKSRTHGMFTMVALMNPNLTLDKFLDEDLVTVAMAI